MAGFWTPERDARLRLLLADGLSGAEIADLMGAPSRSAVIARAGRLRGKKYPSEIARKKQARHAAALRRSKRTALEIDAKAAATRAIVAGQDRDSVIREIARAGMTLRAIGRHFGITHERVRQIIRTRPTTRRRSLIPYAGKDAR